MAGLALVDRNATHPACAAMSVKYMAVPMWLESRGATAPAPCALGRWIASSIARAAGTWPIASRPSITATAPASTAKPGRATGSHTPARNRATCQDRRMTPWDRWPHKSAWTSVSAASRASASGIPARA